ncbi:MAG: alpha/beta hydrolase [Henriciella sp.]|nr:alpha/beta hydrolase [Henriciella sp.]
MSESFQLAGDNRELHLEQSGLVVFAPGLVGSGECFERKDSGKVRSEAGELAAWDEAISETDFEDRHTIVLEADTPIEASGRLRRSSDIELGDMMLTAPLANDETAILMYCDESGGTSFHAPELESVASKVRSSKGQKSATFHFALRHPVDTGGSTTRGFVGNLTSKIFKIIVVKVAPDFAGSLAVRAVQKWEDSNRAFQGLFDENPAFWESEPTELFANFDRIEGKRSLLFIHGTFSTNARTFFELSENGALLETLSSLYEDRVLGFNHQTLTSSVAENVALFYDQFVDHPGSYEFDIIAHSRGGLVARAINDLPDEAIAEALGRHWVRPTNVSIKIRRIVFVATPNEGTIMADPKGVPAFTHRLSTYINMLPDGFISVSMGAVLALASSILEVAMPRLPGLADQVPNSLLQGRLLHSGNQISNFYAFTSNYEPSQGLVDLMKDLAVDSMFQGDLNDLVVPTAGVHSGLGLPQEQLIEFDASAGIHHGTFFGAAEMSQLAEWLR